MIIGLLLLFPIALIYLIICFPIDGISYIRRKKKYIDTLDIIPSLGYIKGICGPIGAGKTTLSAGITTYTEDYVADLAYAKLEYVQTIINNYDFTKLNICLDQLFFDTKMEELIRTTSPLINNALHIKKLNLDTGELEVHDRIYDDGIKKHTYAELINEYIEAYMAIKRNNYVYSNIKYDSIITGNRAFNLKGSDFKIKERLSKKDYGLRRYSVFNYDEATLDAEKINLNWQKSGQADSGTIEHLRLFRHLFRGTSYYTTTLQNPERLVKAERELFNSIIMVREKRDIVVFKRIKHILKAINSINEFTHNMKRKIKKLLHIKNNENKRSRYKDIKRFILKLTDTLNAKDYLEYDVEIYDTAKEAENGSRNSYSTKFVLPKKWCYGPIDTYEYSYQYDAAVEVSKVHPEEKMNLSNIESKIALAQSVLAIKTKRNNDKKEPVKEVPNKKIKVKLGAS